MKSFVNIMDKLFDSLRMHPDKDHEIAELIKHTLNENLPGTTCKRVFISHGNDCSPYIINVIPNMPKTNIFQAKNIIEYDIDIDMDSFETNNRYNGMTNMELIAWLYHELLANVITDETLLRYKRLLIKFYDVNNSAVMDTIKTFGKLLWIGIFSRTSKDYIKDEYTTNAINHMLAELELDDVWNSALAKYICITGGDPTIINDEYVNRMDRTQLREFNKLARRYASYTFKYNNTDYSTMIKYVIGMTNSKLVKYYCEKEPDQMIIFKEKDVYNLFNDRKLLLENVEDIVVDPMLKITSNAAELQAKYNRYVLDVNDIETTSDKLKLCGNIHDLILEISDKLLSVDYDTTGLSNLKEKSIILLDKVNKMSVNTHLSSIEMG